jgi:hypothetical protein
MLRNNGQHNFRSPLLAQGPVSSLILDFAGTGTLDSSITFTRSTTATYTNSSGIISTAAINAPRFDYDASTLTPLGLLIEQSSTNLFLYSQDFTNASWTKLTTTVTGNFTTAPDGTTTAARIASNAGTALKAFGQPIVPVSGSPYTYDIYLKYNTQRYIQFYFDGSANNYANFDIQNGVVGTKGSAVSSATITPAANGYYRLVVTMPLTSGSSIYIVSVDSASASYGSTTSTTNSYYAWGIQREALAFATSYIPTTTAQVTRAADIPPLPISTWYSTTQGTWFAQVNMLSTAGTPRIVGATPSSKAPILISSQAAAMFDSTTTIATANTITANTTQKIAAAWTGTTGLVCLNGGTVATGSQATGYADLTTIGIGYNSTSNNNFINGRIAKIIYYPTALTSAQLQALTT